MRPKTITVSPPIPDADAFATKQQPAASGFVLFTSGAAVTNEVDRNAFCKAQTPDPAGELTMDGIFACALLACPRVVSIYATHDISADTYTLRGRGTDGREQTETLAGPNNATILSAKVYSAIRQVNTDTAATAIVEVGMQAVGTPSEACRVAITASQNESGVGFTLHGLDRYGRYVSETGTLPNATALISMHNYSRIIGLDVSSACASIIQVGTATICESKWVPVERHAEKTLVDVHLSSSWAGEYSIQWTAEDVQATSFSATRQMPSSAYVHTVTGLGSATDASAHNVIDHPISAVRLAIDKFASGNANMRIVQQRQ